ncbi:SAM-dependent methyltransferase [Streptomyces sp. SAS_272]|uniref:SAM-dependent methyltransferase n=1 Tax=Streptomyces sp. SAS_272 TaxID=3412747 RepID=UPI00403C445B
MSLHTPDTTLVRHIRVVGVGAGGAQQLTQAALTQLRAAALVLHPLCPALDVGRLAAGPTESLSAPGPDGADAQGACARVLEQILDRVGAVGDVAVLVPGGPPWAGPLVRELQELADRWEISLQVEPGVPAVRPAAR